jgi:hypothetical protein
MVEDWDASWLHTCVYKASLVYELMVLSYTNLLSVAIEIMITIPVFIENVRSVVLHLLLYFIGSYVAFGRSWCPMVINIDNNIDGKCDKSYD